MEIDLNIVQDLGLALLLGLLVGMQRELKEARIAGFRTFALVTMFGTVSAYLAADYSPWMILIGAIGVMVIIVVGNWQKVSSGVHNIGMTTEVSLLLMYGVGAYIPVGQPAVAAAIAGSTAILLYIKPQLKGMLARLEDTDIRAIMQFVLISFIILPILPNQNFGPLDAFNPQRTWLLVVLIVGISLGGYLIYKFLGQRAGVTLGGILGGLISSTATTVSYSRRASAGEGPARNSAVVIIIAGTMIYPRVMVEIAIMAPDYFWQIAWPVMLMFLFSIGIAIYTYQTITDRTARLPDQRNPSELSSALTFGGVYTLVLFLVALTTEYLGDQYLYIVAGISGLSDMDAITLSASQMVQEENIEADLGWRLILTALITNTFIKFGIASAFGHPELRKRLILAFGLIVAAAALLIIFV